MLDEGYSPENVFQVKKGARGHKKCTKRDADNVKRALLCVDSTTLTKPNAFVTVNSKFQPLATENSQEDTKNFLNQ